MQLEFLFFMDVSELIGLLASETQYKTVKKCLTSLLISLFCRPGHAPGWVVPVLVVLPMAGRLGHFSILLCTQHRHRQVLFYIFSAYIQKVSFLYFYLPKC